jgi:hypothetical protein
LTAPMQLATEGSLTYAATPTVEEGKIEFAFSLPAAGDYIVWAHAFGASMTEDSFHVSIDGGSEDMFDIGSRNSHGIWHWCMVNGRDGKFPLYLDPRKFHLSAGEHTLTFRGRKKNAKLSHIIITDDMYFLPE